LRADGAPKAAGCASASSHQVLRSCQRVPGRDNNPREFKVLRSAPDGQEPRWLGVANFWRYAEVAANGRLLTALARVPLTGEATVELDALCLSGDTKKGPFRRHNRFS
jgi:hypothetical protein